MSARYGRRIDDNQRTLVATLKALGCSVEPHGGTRGAPDLVVGRNGVTELAEVKPLTGVKSRGQLRESQTEWHERWKGRKPIVLRTVEDCVALVRAMQSIQPKSEAP